MFRKATSMFMFFIAFCSVYGMPDNTKNSCENSRRKQNDVNFLEKTEIANKRALETYKNTYEYLERKYMYVIKNFKEDKNFKRTPELENKIWVLWLQGVDNAPDIVKACVKSIKRNAGRREVILLDENNISKYIDIPVHIWKKYKCGTMKPAHFADFIRMVLLYRYGGLWLDSTVFLNGEIPEKIFKNELLFFQISKTKECQRRKYHKLCNWFIYVSKPGNRLIKLAADLQSEFFKNEDKCNDYFINYSIYTLIINNDKASNSLYKKMDYYPEALPFYPQLSKTFYKDIYCRHSLCNSNLPIFKLAYFRKLKRKPGTFYDYFCNREKIPFTKRSK